MLKSNQQPLSTEGLWQTVVEFSLPGEAGFEHQVAEMVSEILVSVHVPDRVLVEAKQAVSKVMEKEMSCIVADQIQRIFTILVQIQSVQSFEMPVNGDNREELHSSPRGWGFFLTEKRILGTELGYAVDHVVMSIHLYHEGHLAEITETQE